MAQINPWAKPAELTTWLHMRGFEKGVGWPKLFRDDQAVQPVTTHLRVEQIGSEEAATFRSTFGLLLEFHPFFSGTIGKPGWHHYMGLDGVQPVATTAMYFSGEVAWLGFGSTLASHSRQGGRVH